jgi:hypothetical protein
MRTLPPAASTEAAIFSRIFEPDKPNLSAAAARSILQLDFPPRDRSRMNALTDKARYGNLTAAEGRELNNFIHVGHLLAIMQSKARQSLKKVPAMPSFRFHRNPVRV